MRWSVRGRYGLNVLMGSFPVLPPKQRDQPLVSTSVRLPKDLIDALDEIAGATDYSRNDVVLHFLRWAVDAYKKQQK